MVPSLQWCPWPSGCKAKGHKLAWAKCLLDSPASHVRMPPASGLFSQASEKNETLWNLILVPIGGATCTNGCSLLSSNSIRTKTLRWHKDPKRVANLSRLACQFKKSTPKSYFRILKLPRLLGMSPYNVIPPKKSRAKGKSQPPKPKGPLNGLLPQTMGSLFGSFENNSKRDTPKNDAPESCFEGSAAKSSTAPHRTPQQPHTSAAPHIRRSRR